jgi:hypothetical protein
MLSNILCLSLSNALYAIFSVLMCIQESYNKAIYELVKARFLS